MAKNPLITLIQAQERQQGGALLLDIGKFNIGHGCPPFC